MKPVSLASMTYEEGLHLLQMRKEALDSGEAKRLPAEVLGDSFFLRDAGNEMLQEKQAAPAWLQNLGKTWNKQPLAMKSTLIGGGLGALGGLGKTVMDDEDDSYFNNMMTGGLAGTALGGGLGLAMDSKTRGNIADRLAGMGDKALNAPDRDASPAERASKDMKVNPETGVSTLPQQEQDAVALEAEDAAKGFIPNIDSKYNTATNLAVRGAELTPAAAGAGVMAKNPAMQADPAAQARRNIGALKTETFAQRFADAEDDQYKKFLDARKTDENTYDAATAKRKLDEGKRAVKPKPAATDRLGSPSQQAAADEFWGRVEDLKRGGPRPEPVPTKLPDLEYADKNLRRSYADAIERFVPGSSPEKIKELMANATPEDLAAFQRLQGMSQKEMDQLFKKLNIAPGQIAGEAGIENLSNFIRRGGETSAAKVIGDPTRQFAPMQALEEVAATKGFGNKAYQAGRSLKRLPKGRMALLAGLGLAGTQGSKLLGFRDLADKSVAEQAKRMEYRNAIENILNKPNVIEQEKSRQAAIDAAKMLAAEQIEKLTGQGGNQ